MLKLVLANRIYAYKGAESNGTGVENQEQAWEIHSSVPRVY